MGDVRVLPLMEERADCRYADSQEFGKERQAPYTIDAPVPLLLMR